MDPETPGGGHVDLSDSSGNVITGTVFDLKLTDVDNIISGAGHLGDGVMMLVNQGTIIASGINALDIDTGLNTIVNSGMLEATGSGGVVIFRKPGKFGALRSNAAKITVPGRGTRTRATIMDRTAPPRLRGGTTTDRNITARA